MRCANVRKLFSAWRDGEISDAVKDQMVTHLESCPRCADAWASYNEALDVLQSDKIVVPDSFREGWRNRIVAAAESLPRLSQRQRGNGKAGRRFVNSPGFPGFLGSGLLPKIAAAAALIVVIGLSVVFGNLYLGRSSAVNEGNYDYRRAFDEGQMGGLVSESAPMAKMETKSFGAGVADGARGMASAPQSSALSGSGNEFGTTAQVVAQQRKIIRTAQITIETESVEEICSRIEMLAASFGGYVQQSSINRNSGASDSNERLSGSVQIAVPSEMFDQVLTQLPSLGKVLHKNVSGQDVTEEYVDLEARLKNWRAQEDQLNLIMTKAHNVEEILAVQNELAQVREQIERLSGRLQYLQRRTDFSDIYFTVVEPDAKQDPTPSPFIEALLGLGSRLWDSIAGLLSFIVIVAPWIGFAVVVFLLVRSWWRKREL